MATTKIILVILCLTAIGGNRRIKRNHLSHERDAAYQRIVTAAQKEIGTREGNLPNTGQKVSEYLRYTGILKPDKWCAAWVSYVFGQAGYQRPKTAWSPDLFPASRQVRTANPGLVLGIYYTSLKRVGHCGIIEQVSGDWIHSIEGNTSSANERDGDGVWRKIRHRKNIRCYADWVPLTLNRKDGRNER